LLGCVIVCLLNAFRSYRRLPSHIRQKLCRCGCPNGYESKIQHDLSGELSKILVDVQALEVDFDVLIGGVLEVIVQSKIDTDKTETWRESGQKFLKSRSRREREKGYGQENRHDPQSAPMPDVE
jgi:hypothetical protein